MKFTKPYRLKPHEFDYWKDTITRTVEWIGKNNGSRNNKRL